jgi:hypothetical protein
MENVWVLASVWVGLALVATLLAIWFTISTALTEIVVGTVAQLIVGVFLIKMGLGGSTPSDQFSPRRGRDRSDISGWRGIGPQHRALRVPVRSALLITTAATANSQDPPLLYQFRQRHSR